MTTPPQPDVASLPVAPGPNALARAAAPGRPRPAAPGPRIEIPPAEQAARAAADPARPRWHVTAPWGWLNDPNGLSVWPGPDGGDLVHLFYQHNPRAPVHDLIEWGHQYSADLIHWTDLPVALEPGPDGPDALGCWSGVIVDDVRPDGGHVPTMVYSGAAGRSTQVCCLATAVPGDALLTRWVKDVANPVIDAAPASTGLDLPEMRDHCVWRENGRWYQLMGSGIPGAGVDGAQGGAALCFSGEDLRNWTYEGPLAVGDGDVSTTGTVWECPDLVRLPGPGGEVDVLTVSAWHEEATMRSMWMTGRRTGTRMEVDLVGRCDLGENYFYAPQSLALPDGRRIVIGWMQPNAVEARRLAVGWAGSMSIPRQMSIADDGTVRFVPVAEVRSLRTRRLVETDGEGPVRLRGDSLNLVLTGRLERVGDGVVIDLAVSVDGSRRNRLSLERAADPADGARGQGAWTGRLRLDRSASAEPGAPWAGEESAELSGPVPLGPRGEVDLRLLLDRSSLEVFVSGQPLSARLGVDPADQGVVVDAGALADARLEAWEMGESYPAGRLGAAPRACAQP